MGSPWPFQTYTTIFHLWHPIRSEAKIKNLPEWANFVNLKCGSHQTIVKQVVQITPWSTCLWVSDRLQSLGKSLCKFEI